MEIIRTIPALRAALRAAGGSVGFVPTMGAFHDGHASLMRRAREECDTVVVSLFVNPAQFPDRSVFEAYPRDEARDARIAGEQGVDLLFAPEAAEMYPDGFATEVRIDGPLSQTLIRSGLSGDGQLTGMCTVIVKLLNIVGPDIVYFGEKDLPHWIAVERMAGDLNVPAEIRVLPTVREADGLAMSSRNVHLGPHRARAACVPRALNAALAVVAEGGRDPRDARARALAELAAEGVDVEYFEILDGRTLCPVDDLATPAVVAIGARVGAVSLLDIARTAPPTHDAAAGRTTAAHVS
ncbi:pantoate--beta-alanine ligase [Actinocorallia sp. A-T 12471]|uniref:pantoate--beta-alanine ligase n=1 Tax=Actinocorallia sp. A-T 12471 TaxID=3089813 RepID=UPI0029CD5EDF|nr:pantoate--beta-alanine ligase [Actinocorallia sp. A-T 12471]MDX6741768.1 pantoate--beta-alanine ligase [Actinocorallia sp. A-T 12471]